MCKNDVLLRDIIFKYDLLLKIDVRAQQLFLRDPADINVERMVEKTMARVGGYNSVGDCPIEGAHKDFSDGSECKTASIASKHYGTSRNSFTFTITGVMSSGGNMKTGDLRVVLYNPHLNKCHFMYIPNSHLKNKLNVVKTTRNIGNIGGSWNSKKNSFGKFDEYLVDSFIELAEMTSEKFENKINEKKASQQGINAAWHQKTQWKQVINPYDYETQKQLHMIWTRAYLLTLQGREDII
jgi:hypothetical protein